MLLLVEPEDLHLGRQVDLADLDLVRQLQRAGGEVEDGSDAGRHDRVGDLLSRGRWRGDQGNRDGPLPGDPREIRHRLNREPRNPGADHVRVAVGDLFLDLSVRGKLETMATALKN